MEAKDKVTSMWEILVPTVRNDGRPIRTRFHRVWDTKVREITGGLTILPVAKGQWVSPSGELFLERMIPVRIACTRKQIEEIIQMTIKYYEQQAVLAYLISETVLIRFANENQNSSSSGPEGKLEECSVLDNWAGPR
jgi:hypothetical protein